MAYGSFYLTRKGSTSTYITFVCSWNSTTDIANNRSFVNVNVVATKSSSSTQSTYGSQVTSATVDGNTQSNSGSFTLRPNNSITLLSKSYTVYHNSDGRKTTTINVDVGGNVMWASGSADITLDNIPRESKITSLGDYCVEGEHWLEYQKYSDYFVCDVEVYVKRPDEPDSNYSSVHNYQNYYSGQHLKFTNDELRNIVYRKFSPNEIFVKSNRQECTHLDTKYVLRTYQNGNYVGEDTRVVKGYIEYALIINEVVSSTVEGVHRIAFTNFSNNTNIGLWITAKPAGTGQYVTVAGRQNYVGNDFYYEQGERTTIYKILAPEIKLDSRLDFEYHVEIWATDGNFAREIPIYTNEHITQATASITSVNDTAVEDEHCVFYTSYSRYFSYRLVLSARKHGTDNDWWNVGAYNVYASGTNVKISDEDTIKVYKLAMPDTNVGVYVDFRYEIQTLSDPNGYIIQRSVLEKPQIINGNTYIKINGDWKNSVPFLNVKGTWKPCVTYANANKVWKRGIVQ